MDPERWIFDLSLVPLLSTIARKDDEADKYSRVHEERTATYKAEPRIRIIPIIEREVGTVWKKIRSRTNAKTIWNQ